MHAPEGEFPAVAADILVRLRRQRPRVHCITNTVAQAFTANMLLAAGAVPSMTIAPEEVADFVVGADALLVNLGTLDRGRRDATGIAIDRATELGVRWLLDPVFIEHSPTRAVFAQALVRMHPNAVRLNRREFAAIADAEADDDALSRFATETGTVIVLTGDTDVVTDGTQLARIANGHPWMTLVTGMGCAASALVAACLAVEPDPWRAATAGLLALGVAGEMAAEDARGPGSLAVGIIDALHRLESSELASRARVA